MATALHFRQGILSAALLAFSSLTFGQGIINDNAKMSVTPATLVKVTGGGFTNRVGGQVSNAGVIELDGDWVNNDPAGVFGTTFTAGVNDGSVVL